MSRYRVTLSVTDDAGLDIDLVVIARDTPLQRVIRAANQGVVAIQDALHKKDSQ